jgi:hypothetical protein
MEVAQVRLLDVHDDGPGVIGHPAPRGTQPTASLGGIDDGKTLGRIGVLSEETTQLAFDLVHGHQREFLAVDAVRVFL